MLGSLPSIIAMYRDLCFPTAGEVDQIIKCLLGKHKGLGAIVSSHLKRLAW